MEGQPDHKILHHFQVCKGHKAHSKTEFVILLRTQKKGEKKEENALTSDFKSCAIPTFSEKENPLSLNPCFLCIHVGLIAY